MRKFRRYPRSVEREAAAYRVTAALGLIEAELACLNSRRAVATDSAAAFDLNCQIRDAMARRTVLLGRERAHNAA